MSRKVNQEYRDEDDEDDGNSYQEEDVSEISVSSMEYDGSPTGKRKLKPGKKKELHKEKPRKKIKKNKFVEEEAEEASEDEEDLDEDVKKKPEVRDKEFEKQFNDIIQKREGRDVIKKIEERYKDLPEGDAQELYEADGLDSNEDDIEPPRNEDPKVWRVSCTRGKEIESAMSLMFKFANHKAYNSHLQIVSAFALKKFPGCLFVEAHYDWQVQQAIENMYNIRYSNIEMILPEQCISLFTPTEAESIPFNVGQWVRVKSHQIYQGDLGRVLSIDDKKRTVQIKLIPREKRELTSFSNEATAPTKLKTAKQTQQSQFTMKGEVEEENKNDEQKPTKWFYRTKFLIDQKRYIRGPKIPIKLDKNINSMNDEQSIYYYSSIATERERCKKDGFIQIYTSVSNVLWKNIKPLLEELSYFYPDLKNIRSILPRLEKSLKAAAGTKSLFKIGEKVHVAKGSSVKFIVKEILPDGKVLLTHTSKDKDTNELKVQELLADPDTLTVAFAKYQQVTVFSGPNAGIQGVILDLKTNSAIISTDQNKIIECQFTDMQSQKKIQGYDQSINSDPFKAQVQLTEEQNKINNVSGISRNDLIKFGTGELDIGCVLSISKDEMTVLDLTNKIKYINQLSVSAKLNTRNNVSKNLHRHEIHQGDLIIVLDGFYKGCKGTVIHVYKDCIFLHSGKFDQTQGIIVEKVNNCALISSATAGTQQKQFKTQQSNKDNNQDDLNKLVGSYLTIQKGQWATYRGMVMGVQAKTVTLQLTAKNLTVKVLKDDIIASEGGSSHVQPGKTPHYAPQQSVRVWGDEHDNQRAQPQGYQSPYVYGQTPMHE